MKSLFAFIWKNQVNGRFFEKFRKIMSFKRGGEAFCGRLGGVEAFFSREKEEKGGGDESGGLMAFCLIYQ